MAGGSGMGIVGNGGVRRRLWAGWDAGSQGQAGCKGSWAQAKEFSLYTVQEHFCLALALVLAFCLFLNQDGGCDKEQCKQALCIPFA